MASPFSVFLPTQFGLTTPAKLERPYSRDTYSLAALGPGSYNYENQLESLRPAFQQRADDTRRAEINRTLGQLYYPGAYNPLAIGQPGATAIPPTKAGPFTSIALTKDPELESMVNQIVSSINAGRNSELIREPRSKSLEGEISAAFERFRGDTSNARQSLKDFNEEFLSLRPVDRGTLEQENKVLGTFFGGAEDPNSLAAALARNAAERERAVAQSSDRALGILGRSGKVGRLLSGDSSFLDKQLLDAASAIMAQEALDQATLGRQNIMDVAGIQGQLAGRRGELADQFLRRALLPMTAQQAVSGEELRNLSTLGGLDLSNILLERNADRIARDLGLLGGVRDLRRDLRFEGLQKEVYDPLTGFAPIMQTPAPSGLDIGTLLRLLQGNQGAAPAPVEPDLKTTYGQLMQAYNPLTARSGELNNYPMLPGSTIFNRYGDEFIRSAEGVNQPVGWDRLTDLQRWYEG